MYHVNLVSEQKHSRNELILIPHFVNINYDENRLSLFLFMDEMHIFHKQTHLKIYKRGRAMTLLFIPCKFCQSKT